MARRNGLTPHYLFTWLRQALRQKAAGIEPQAFVPAVVECAVSAKSVRKARKPSRSTGGDAGTIEIQAGSLTVNISRGADVKVVAAVMTALKASQ